VSPLVRALTWKNLRNTERRKGFEPSTPSLGSWPGHLERTHGALAPDKGRRLGCSRDLADASTGTFGSTFGDAVNLRCGRAGGRVAESRLPPYDAEVTGSTGRAGGGYGDFCVRAECSDEVPSTMARCSPHTVDEETP
jgi:hypothetical protein